MIDRLTAEYVKDLTKAPDIDSLTFATVRALEVIGHNTDLLPRPDFTIWAMATAAKARRLELAELYPAQSFQRTMVAMGTYQPTLPTYRLAQLRATR